MHMNKFGILINAVHNNMVLAGTYFMCDFHINISTICLLITNKFQLKVLRLS